MSRISRTIEEKAMIIFSGAAAVFVSLILVYILGTITMIGLPSINLTYLTSAEVNVQGLGHAIGNAIIGTIYLSSLSVIIATPFAIGTAIYLTKYAKDNNLTKFIRLIIEVFSGTPSIILGVVGFILICYYLKPISGGWSMISASVTLSVLILPVIERACEDAINTVPQEIEDGSYALGATKWDTVKGVIVPYSISGILTGMLLGVGRSAEESAVVLLTAGYSQFYPSYGMGANPKLLFGIQIFPFQDSIATLPIAIYNAYEYPQSIDPIKSAFPAAFILILIVLSINMIARFIIRRWRIG